MEMPESVMEKWMGERVEEEEEEEEGGEGEGERVKKADRRGREGSETRRTLWVTMRRQEAGMYSL